MKRVKQDIAIFTASGISYCFIEILWRRYTHWTMAIIGGICFLILFRIFTSFEKISLIKKCLIGSGIITIIEFISGCIVNIWLKMGIWDYSSLPVNILGQVCLIYSFLWALLSIPIVYLSNKINKLNSTNKFFKQN